MLLRVLEQLARRRRRPGSHPAWMAVSLATFLLRQHKKRAHRHEVALREELHPGETLVITHLPEPRG
jgi:hypothetical protein